jgi:phage-related protein
MAWGIWNKIKNGIKKVIGGIGKAAKWVNDKIIKPIVKPIAGALAPVIDGFMPGLGSGIKRGVDIGSDYADKLAPKLKNFGDTNSLIRTQGGNRVGRNGGGIRRLE